MTNKRLLVFATTLLLVPIVWAVPADEFETFEDDVVGNNPTASWYTLFESGGASSNVIAPGLDGSGQAFIVSGASARVEFDIIDDQYDSFAFTVTVSTINTGSQNMNFCETSGADHICAGSEIGFQFNFFDSGGQWGLSGCGATLIPFSNPGDEYDVLVTFNYTAQTHTCYVDGVQTGTPDTANLNTMSLFGSWLLFTSGASPPDVIVDDLLLNGNELPPADTAPPAGLSAEVSKGGSSSTTGFVTLIWPLSIDDTDQSTGDFQYQVFVNGTLEFTDTIDSKDGNGVRTASYAFSGSSAFGNRTFGVKAFDTSQVSASELSCTVTVDLDTLGDLDSCGTGATIGGPAEFDTGLESTIESFGFQTEESKAFFSILFIGLVTVSTSVVSRYVPAGRFKNYIVLGAGATAGIFPLILDWLALWEWFIAFILALFIIRGGAEAINGYHRLKSKSSELMSKASVAIEAFTDQIREGSGVRESFSTLFGSVDPLSASDDTTEDDVDDVDEVDE